MTNKHGLTPRDVEILKLLASGCSDKEIADALRISRRTANGHVHDILVRLDARNRAAAVAKAIRVGLMR